MKVSASLDTIILYVQNVDKLKAFYTQTFNFPIVDEYGSLWALLSAGQAKIGLHQMGEKYLSKFRSDSKFDNNTKIVLEIDGDIDQVRTYLIEQNIPMREVKTFGNYDFWLCDGEDPEGNVFQLKQKKQAT